MREAGQVPEVAFLVGADDDVVLDARNASARRAAPPPTSRYEGAQADAAIAAAVASRHPGLRIATIKTLDELRATRARVVVVLSYLTQTSYAWYDAFFATLRRLEERGVAVYPSAGFKELISSKARYLELLGHGGLPICPTRVLHYGELVGAEGGLDPARVESAVSSACVELGLLSSSDSEFQVVSKPSNADGGYGVAFWTAAAGEPALLSRLRLGAILSCGCKLPALDVAPPSPPTARTTRSRGRKRSASRSASPPAATALHASAPLGAMNHADAPFVKYLESVGFCGGRPHVLLQPLMKELGRHYEVKIYFLRRRLFYAALTYGKERVVARVVRPSTDAALFRYLQPLVDESVRALDLLPEDGPLNPGILMRVDWCVRSCNDEEPGATRVGAYAGAPLREELRWRASSLSEPNARLQRQMRAQPEGASLAAHFINEIEIHPGFYVDWDDEPDATLEPLAAAYGDYIQQLLGCHGPRAPPSGEAPVPQDLAIE